MPSKDMKARVSVLVLFVVMVASLSAFAGSAVVGSVAGSMNATISGQTLLPNTTVFSGDSLAVKDGAAVVAVGHGSRLVFGRETVASFLRESDELTVLLGQGNVSLYHPNDRMGLRVKVGEVTITPARGFKTLGEVAMVAGAVVVTAKEGVLKVEGNGTAVDVAKGQTITLAAKPARAPQGAPGAGISASTALQIGSVATGVTSTVMSGVAISRAGDARDAAQAADATAQQAVAAAEAAADAAHEATAAAEAILDAICESAISESFPACSP